jgi:glycosyltransferase involved in cell wall biosynthesis
MYIKKIIYKLEKSRIAKYEKYAIDTYKKCVLNTQADKEFLGNHRSLYVHPMGVNCLEEIPVEYQNNKIAFIGNMRTLQNQDAVQFFVYDIFPLIKKNVPEAVFYIIGAEPPSDIKKLADESNVFVTGFVDSVEEKIKNAAVAVAPVRIAAGIQNKVLVAMACGVPVVLTSLISAGIPELVSGSNCIIADKKEAFAHNVVSLMQDKNMRNCIGKSGYDMVKSEYAWETKLAGYEVL